MAKETMNLGESFSATVTRGGQPVETKPRHYWIGWAVIVALLGGGGYWLGHQDHTKPAVMQENPGFKEMLGKKFGGVLYYDIIRASINMPKNWDIAAMAAGIATGHKQFEQTHFGPIRNTVVNEGENVLEDCFEGNAGSACTQVALFKFHGIGSSSASITESDGGCTTEATTEYNPDSTRATGSQTNNGANVYRTVGTNTVDGSFTVEEFCLMDVNTGAGNMWTRILTGTVSLSASDSLQTTYDLTIE